MEPWAREVLFPWEGEVGWPEGNDTEPRPGMRGNVYRLEVSKDPMYANNLDFSTLELMKPPVQFSQFGTHLPEPWPL